LWIVAAIAAISTATAIVEDRRKHPPAGRWFRTFRRFAELIAATAVFVGFLVVPGENDERWRWRFVLLALLLAINLNTLFAKNSRSHSEGAGQSEDMGFRDD